MYKVLEQQHFVFKFMQLLVHLSRVYLARLKVFSQTPIFSKVFTVLFECFYFMKKGVGR